LEHVLSKWRVSNQGLTPARVSSFADEKYVVNAQAPSALALVGKRNLKVLPDILIQALSYASETELHSLFFPSARYFRHPECLPEPFSFGSRPLIP